MAGSQHATDGIAIANVEVAVLAQVIRDVVSCALSNRLVIVELSREWAPQSILEAKTVNKRAVLRKRAELSFLS